VSSTPRVPVKASAIVHCRHLQCGATTHRIAEMANIIGSAISAASRRPSNVIAGLAASGAEWVRRLVKCETWGNRGIVTGPEWS